MTSASASVSGFPVSARTRPAISSARSASTAARRRTPFALADASVAPHARWTSRVVATARRTSSPSCTGSSTMTLPSIGLRTVSVSALTAVTLTPRTAQERAHPADRTAS